MRQGFYRRLLKIKHLHWHTVRVNISPTMKCTQNCYYCSRHFTGKMTVKKSENQLSPDEWLQRINGFPGKVDLVTISGGEPHLYYGIADLINGLTKCGYSVIMYSNLTRCNGSIEPNKRFRITTTLHEGADAKRFINSVDYYKNRGIRVDVDMMNIKFPNNFFLKRKRGGGIVEKGVILEGTESWRECVQGAMFNYAPDGQLFTSCGQMWYQYVHGDIRKSILWEL